MSEPHRHTVRLGPGECAVCGLRLSQYEMVDPRDGLMPPRRVYRYELLDLIERVRAASAHPFTLDALVDRLKEEGAKSPEGTDSISREEQDAYLSVLDYADIHGVRLR